METGMIRWGPVSKSPAGIARPCRRHRSFASAAWFAGNTARLDSADPSIAGVTFNNAAMGYTIAQGSGGGLTLQGGGTPSGPATVTVMAGNDIISRPLHLAATPPLCPPPQAA